MAKINKSILKKINKKIARKLISGAAQRVSKTRKYSGKGHVQSSFEEKPVVVYRSASSKKRSALTDNLYKKMTIEKPPEGYWQRTVKQEEPEEPLKQEIVESVVSEEPMFDEENGKTQGKSVLQTAKIDSDIDLDEPDFFLPEIVEMSEKLKGKTETGEADGPQKNPFEYLKENALFEEPGSGDSKSDLSKPSALGFSGKQEGRKITSGKVQSHGVLEGSFKGAEDAVASRNAFIPADSVVAPTVPMAVFSQSPKVYRQIDFSQIKAVGRGEADFIVNKMGMKNLPETMHKIPKDLIKKMSSEWEPVDLKKVDEKYSLIEPYAYSNIKWIDQLNGLMYYVLEPPLTEREKKTLNRIKTLLVDFLDVNLFELKKEEKIRDYIYNKMDHIIQDYAIFLTKSEYEKMKYYIERDFIGLEIIEPFMRDKEIEDVSCIGVNLPIYIFHRKYGSIKTNKKFTDAESLNSYLIKLAQRCGRHISVADPLLDGSLEDGSRVQATYSSGNEISMKGSTFTIRKFTKDPLTIVDLIISGTMPSMMVAFLWLAIEYKQSLLISGGTASGKTSTLNSISMLLPPGIKIISIEDTPEINLPHENWVPKVIRTGFGSVDVTGKRQGEVSMFDLLKAALRERPDEIIVGEVRGVEANVLFQGMATGHPGMATIHAGDFQELLNRLITKPINLPLGLLSSLDLVLFMHHSRIKQMEVRRVTELIEIVKIDIDTGRPITNVVMKWNPADDTFAFVSDKSYILNKIIEQKGTSEESLWTELRRRAEVLDWMKKSNIRHYKEVGKIINTYYKNPDEILKNM